MLSNSCPSRVRKCVTLTLVAPLAFERWKAGLKPGKLGDRLVHAGRMLREHLHRESQGQRVFSPALRVDPLLGASEARGDPSQ